MEHGLALMRRHSGDWFIHPAMKQLRQYDAQNRTEFCQTLYHYLRCERSYTRTSREMGLHRNTLLYRIERIQELTQLDLENADLRLHLLLSFALSGSEEF